MSTQENNNESSANNTCAANDSPNSTGIDFSKGFAGFSAEEIESFIHAAERIASKSVLHAVMEILKEGPAKGFDAKTSKRLIKQVNQKLKYNDSGYASCEFEGTTHKLGISLTLADKDFRVQADVPSLDYAKNLYKQYDTLKNFAKGFWLQFIENNPALYKKLAEYRTDVDFGELVVDPANPTTMYFDPLCAKRVSLYTFMMTADGKLLYKK